MWLTGEKASKGSFNFRMNRKKNEGKKRITKWSRDENRFNRFLLKIHIKNGPQHRMRLLCFPPISFLSFSSAETFHNKHLFKLRVFKCFLASARLQMYMKTSRLTWTDEIIKRKTEAMSQSDLPFHFAHVRLLLSCPIVNSHNDFYGLKR